MTRLSQNLISMARNAVSAGLSRADELRIQLTTEGMEYSISGGAFAVLVNAAARLVAAAGIEFPLAAPWGDCYSSAAVIDDFGDGDPRWAAGYNYITPAGQTEDAGVVDAALPALVVSIDGDYGTAPASALYGGFSYYPAGGGTVQPLYVEINPTTDEITAGFFANQILYFERSTNGQILAADETKFEIGSPVKLPAFAKASLPTATTNQLIWVTDEVGGPVPAYADGTNWRRVSDGAIVS